jgi:hypothetical protein
MTSSTRERERNLEGGEEAVDVHFCVLPRPKGPRKEGREEGREGGRKIKEGRLRKEG